MLDILWETSEKMVTVPKSYCSSFAPVKTSQTHTKCNKDKILYTEEQHNQKSIILTMYTFEIQSFR